MSTKNTRAGSRSRLHTTVLLTVIVGIMAPGCQSQVEAAAEQAPAPRAREAQPAPAGIDLGRPADRIAEQIQRLHAERAERFRSVPADRAELILRREADAVIGWTPACLQHVVVAAPTGTERVRCVMSR